MELDCEVKHFGCKFLPKIGLSRRTEIERCQLLGSTKYGHILIANEMEIKVFKKTDIHTIFTSNKASATADAPLPVAVLTFPSIISHVAISCDNLVIAAVTLDKKISLIDVRSLENTPSVFAQVSQQATCTDIMWNPGLPTVLATATVTGEVTVWEMKGDSLTRINTKPTFGASCLSWSSKGKQLAVGTNDGKIFNLKPTLDEARCTQAPTTLFSGTALVRDIFWISTFEYIAVYEHNDTIKVVHVQNQKDKNIPTKFNDFDDIFYSEAGRSISVLFAQILPWNTLILGCSRGIELAVIGSVPDKSGQFLFNLDEGSRAEMPYADGEPTYPVGMCIDYNYNQPFSVNEKAIEPCPVLLALTSEGVLASFRLMNLNEKESLVAVEEVAPALPPARSKSLISLQSNMTKPDVSKQEPAKLPLFGANPVNTTSKLVVPTLPSAPAPVAPSSAPLSGFGAKLPTVPEVKSDSQTSGLLASLPQTKVMSEENKVVKQPLSHKQSVTLASKSVEKQNAALPEKSKKNLQENHANLDSVFAKSISDEISKFSAELEQHKAASKGLEDVRDILSTEEMKAVNEKMKLMEQKLSAVHEIISTINVEVYNDKDTLLVALASLEESKGYYNCYNDPSYIALLKSRPLDKMTKKLRDDLFAKFAQMQSLVDELNLQLDTEWENMHSSKKSTPTSRTIYKTLSQHRVISNEQEKLIHTLLEQLSNLTLRPVAKSPPKPQAAKAISPMKQRILKCVFESHKPKSKVVTSPAKLNISSFNSNYSKQTVPLTMSENGNADSDVPSPDNINQHHATKPDPVKFGIPVLSYSEKPKFDSEDPSKLIESDDRVPSVVLKYMPSTPQVIPSSEEKVKGAKELVSKMVDFVQKEKDSSLTQADTSYTEKFVPVMRTKGPIAPGQAPNAVIQPIAAVSKDIVAVTQPTSVPSLFGIPAIGGPSPAGTSLFGLPKTNSTSPKSNTATVLSAEPSSGLFGFGTSQQGLGAVKTPVVDGKSIFGTQPPASSTGLFAPVSTPPLNSAQLGSKTAPILVTPRTQTPTQSNLFGGLKPAPSNRPSSPSDSFPVFGVPAAEFNESRKEAVESLDYNGSSEESSESRASSAASETDVKASSSTASTEPDEPSNPPDDPKNEPNIFLSPVANVASEKTDESKKDSLFAAAPSSTNIFALANSSTTTGNIFSSLSSDSPIGSGGSTLGFFAPVQKADKNEKKDSSPSIGGSLTSSQEKSPVTPPQTTEVGKVETKPALSEPLKQNPPAVKSLFGPDSKENKDEGGLFDLKISTSENSTETSTNNVFGGLSLTQAESESSDSFGAKSGSNPFASNLFGDKPASSTNKLFGSPVTTSVSAPEVSTNIFSTGSSPNSGIFNTTTTAVISAGNNLFSSTSTASSGALFGSTKPTDSGGLFGATPTSSSGGLFGSPASTSSGLFGSASSASSGLFGSPATTVTSGGLFGSSQTASSNIFGSPSTAVTTTTASGIFGGASNNSSGLFGAVTASSSGGFGASPNTNIFGSAPTTNIFGSTTSSGFGSGSSLLGSGTATSTTTSSGFGTSISSSGFGSNNNQSAFGGAPAFGSAPSFGSGPSFGSTQGFGSAPAFGSAGAFGGTSAAAQSFGNQSMGGSVFGSSTGFGGGNSGSGPTFGGVAASGGGIFGSGTSAPTGFGNLSNQNSGGFLSGNTGQSGGFLGGGNTGQSNSGGFNTNTSSSFSSWR